MPSQANQRNGVMKTTATATTLKARTATSAREYGECKNPSVGVADSDLDGVTDPLEVFPDDPSSGRMQTRRLRRQHQRPER